MPQGRGAAENAEFGWKDLLWGPEAKEQGLQTRALELRRMRPYGRLERRLQGALKVPGMKFVAAAAAQHQAKTGGARELWWR